MNPRLRRFRWRGVVPPSKSIAIRHLVIADYVTNGDRYRIDVADEGDDVRHTKTALQALSVGQTAHCGDGGAVLRFLALRASRLRGVHRLTGEARLFERPIKPLVDVLHALGVGASVDGNALVIESRGSWRLDRAIEVNGTVSSQFASAVLLNAWRLPKTLRLELGGVAVSMPYRAMTLAVVRGSGLRVEERSNTYESSLLVAPSQVVRPGDYTVESDASSAFSIAAAGAIGGSVTIERFPFEGLQPDARFPELLERMGAQIRREGGALLVARGETPRGIDADLADAPDLFCVLAVCCALAKGRSRLRGAPQLRHKESDRVARTAELLRGLGRPVDEHEDGLDVVGQPGDFLDARPFAFDAESDHRLAMAAGVAMRAGARIDLDNSQVVSKSFPEFWQCLGISP